MQAMRQLPIRWRILSLAALNAIVVFVFAAVIWDGARVLTDARNELRQTRDSDRLLTQLEADAVRLQGLIHRYFTQPNVDLLMEITGLRETVMTTPEGACRRRSDPQGRGGAAGAGDRAVRRRLQRPAQRAERDLHRLREPGAAARCTRWPASTPSWRTARASRRR